MTKISTKQEEYTGWWAEASFAGNTIIGRGETEEIAMRNLWITLDELFWELLDLKDQTARMTTEIMNRDHAGGGK